MARRCSCCRRSRTTTTTTPSSGSSWSCWSSSAGSRCSTRCAGQTRAGCRSPWSGSPSSTSVLRRQSTSSVSLLSSGVFGWHGGVRQAFSALPNRIGVVGSQKKRPVVLTESDRDELVRLTRTGVHPASMIMRARVLLALDTSGGEVDAKEVLAARLGVSGETLRLVAKRFAETGGDAHATISRKQRELPPVVSVVTGEVEARLIALA